MSITLLRPAASLFFCAYRTGLHQTTIGNLVDRDDHFVEDAHAQRDGHAAVKAVIDFAC